MTTMFKIKWRNRKFLKVITGLSSYPDRAAAARQIEIWQRVFPANTYYVEST